MKSLGHADVVVVGCGSAGIAAAVSAAEEGARVFVLEKQSRGTHTPTSKMGGSYVMTVSDAERATTYLDRCAGGTVPYNVSKKWAEVAAFLPDWILHLDTRLDLKVGTSHLYQAAYPEFEGAEAIVTYLASLPESSGLMGVEWFNELAGALARHRTIDVLWETTARRLVSDSNGRVIGVEVQAPGGSGHITAGSGVVLASGGFEFDERAKRDYLRAYPIHFAGNPANTGDGLRMALAAGADLWHMNVMEGRFVGHFPLPDGHWVNVQPNFNPPGYLVVDRWGERFSNEERYTKIETYWYEAFLYDGHERGFSRIPFFWLFDSRRMKAGPLTPVTIGQPAVGLYSWSSDNSVELDRGWIHRGNTIEEAAASAGIVGIDQATVTAQEYNAACVSGKDRFGRPPASLVPLDAPPFYCVELYPGGAGTAGGPRRDEVGRVLDPFGAPIRGLYAAGSVSQMVGDLYPSSGAGFSDALCGGIVAGEAAARGE